MEQLKEEDRARVKNELGYRLEKIGLLDRLRWEDGEYLLDLIMAEKEKSHFCSHPNNNKDGICELCLGIEKDVLGVEISGTQSVFNKDKIKQSTKKALVLIRIVSILNKYFDDRSKWNNGLSTLETAEKVYNLIKK